MDSDKYLAKLCIEGMERRGALFVASQEVYSKRLRMEYNLVKDLGYSDYFLIIWDIVKWSKENGILTGPARGSVAASLLAFLLGITDVDPIRFGLMFERFLNPVRGKTDPPDIDLDFQASKRDVIKSYIMDKYGRDRVCGIGSSSRAFASGTIKDVAKVMGLGFHELNAATSGQMFGMDLEEAYNSVDDFRRWVDSDDLHEEAYDIAKQLEGLVRHNSVHPAGLVIAPGPIEEYVPVHKVKDVICTQWRDVNIAKRGLLKVDILGLKTLDVLQKTMEYIGHKIDFLSVDLEDPKILDLFDRGDTGAIFQFEAYHQRTVAKNLGISSFDELVLVTALSRPGSSRTGVTDSVIERKHGREEVEYPDPMVEELLKPTYGHPVYQEQIMRMANLVGDIPLSDTELMRAAMKKKDRDAIVVYADMFIANAVGKGVSQVSADEMWRVIEGSADYGFNKAHATAYSLLAVFCAYLKIYHPREFMAGALSCETDTDKIVDLVKESRGLGIEVLPVNINSSGTGYTLTDSGIVAGLTGLKYVGKGAAEAIVKHRPYRSLEDFIDKVPKRQCNSRVVESLKAGGAFGSKYTSPPAILDCYGCWMGKLPDVSVDKDLLTCQWCDLCEVRHKVVPGTGGAESGIMFVGEAPGNNEDLTGFPFIGKAGKMLRDDWLPALDLDEDEVWITNTVKCAPKDEGGKIGKPTDKHIQTCAIWLEKEIELIQPEIIVALGSYALRGLSKERSIMEVHGKEFEVITPCLGKKGIRGFALLHPAYFLYKGGAEGRKIIHKDITALYDMIWEGQ